VDNCRRRRRRRRRRGGGGGGSNTALLTEVPMDWIKMDRSEVSSSLAVLMMNVPSVWNSSLSGSLSMPKCLKLPDGNGCVIMAHRFSYSALAAVLRLLLYWTTQKTRCCFVFCGSLCANRRRVLVSPHASRVR
jgi:hypothetical protein